MNRYDIENFCCEECLIENVIEELLVRYELSKHDCSSVAILCKEDLAQTLIKLLGSIEVNGQEIEYGYLDFDRYDYGYEYAVLLCVVDGEITLSVEKAKYEDEFECNEYYKRFIEDIVFISDECNSKLLIEQIKNEVNIVAFSLGDEN